MSGELFSERGREREVIVAEKEIDWHRLWSSRQKGLAEVRLSAAILIAWTLKSAHDHLFFCGESSCLS